MQSRVSFGDFLYSVCVCVCVLYCLECFLERLTSMISKDAFRSNSLVRKKESPEEIRIFQSGGSFAPNNFVMNTCVWPFRRGVEHRRLIYIWSSRHIRHFNQWLLLCLVWKCALCLWGVALISSFRFIRQQISFILIKRMLWSGAIHSYSQCACVCVCVSAWEKKEGRQTHREAREKEMLRETLHSMCDVKWDFIHFKC